MPKVKCSPFRATRRLCCASFPKPLCEKYGWRSCKNCDDVRLLPDRVRKVDNRKCLRNHEGKSKLININIVFNGDDSSGDDSLMDQSDQENIHNTSEEFGDERVTRHASGSVGNVITPAAVTTSGVKAGRDSRQISKKWWDDHRKSVQDLNLENDKLKEEATRLREENQRLKGNCFYAN